MAGPVPAMDGSLSTCFRLTIGCRATRPVRSAAPAQNGRSRTRYFRTAHPNRPVGSLPARCGEAKLAS